MTLDQALYVHSLIDPQDPETRIAGGNAVLQVLAENFGPGTLEARGLPTVCSDPETGKHILRMMLHLLLRANRYTHSAALCWGTALFDPRPHSVQVIWKGLRKHARLLIYGAGSLGKSYTVMAHDILTYEEDPEFTTIKLVSTTAGHARANTFSTLVMFHRNSAIPLSGYIRQGFIGLDKDDKRSSIAEVAIPPGQDGKGRLQGFHPLPRPYPHPKFGSLTRVIGRFDEAEDIPIGLWKGEANMMLNMDDELHVAIAAMWNPKRRDSMAAQKAEPIGGWAAFDESLEEYTSKEGYHVIRLDARRCENVIQKRIVYPGLVTYRGFKELEDRGGPDFDTFGKGVYPSETAVFNIVPGYALDKSKGVFLWAKNPTEWGTFDTANEVEGEAMFTAGKYGQAVAFQPEAGPVQRFNVPRWSIQIDQQFPVIKNKTDFMGRELIRLCHMLRIKPDWFAMDRTGNGSFLHDWMVLNFGPCLGIQWGETATELPILEEDNEKACDLYADVVSEMWFAFAAWAEFGYLAFAPHMDTSKVFGQLTGRQYKRINKIQRRAESKGDFKKRYAGQSPNEADSVVMGVHLIRHNARPDQTAAMSPQLKPPTIDYHTAAGARPGEISFETSGSVVDKQDFIH